MFLAHKEKIRRDVKMQNLKKIKKLKIIFAIPNQTRIGSFLFAFHHHIQSMVVCEWPVNMDKRLVTNIKPSHRKI